MTADPDTRANRPSTSEAKYIPFLTRFVSRDAKRDDGTLSGLTVTENGTRMTLVKRETTDDR